MRASLAITLLLCSVEQSVAIFGFGGKNDENLFETGQYFDLGGNGDNNDLFNLNNGLNDNFALSGENSLFKMQVDALAKSSVADEAEKFAEALQKVMGDRVKEYMKVKIADEDKVEKFAKKIINTPKFKRILDNNLVEFKEFYMGKIDTTGAKISRDAAANFQLISANMKMD